MSVHMQVNTPEHVQRCTICSTNLRNNMHCHYFDRHYHCSIICNFSGDGNFFFFYENAQSDEDGIFDGVCDKQTSIMENDQYSLCSTALRHLL